MFGKSKNKSEEKTFETEIIGIKDIISPASVKISQGNIKIGETLSKTFFVFSFPRYLSTGWFSPVVNLDAPMDISLFSHPLKSANILKKLRKKVAEIEAELIEREEKGLVREPELEIAHHDLEELRDKLQTASERMFRLGIYITIYGNTEKELNQTETALRSILEARLIYIKPALFQQRNGFISAAPYGLDRLSVHTPMNTAPLSSVFPFISFNLTSNEGVLYGINQHNNSLVLFDRFSLENANSVLFGKAGSGKSLDYHSPVLIKERGAIQLVHIGALVEKLIKQYGAVPVDKEIEGVISPQGIEVYSFDKNFKGKWSAVTVAMRKKSPKILYKFKTQKGREITTTGDHNMIILKDGKVIAAKGSEIKGGEYVPLPRFVSKTTTPIRSLNLLSLLKNSQKIYVQGAEKLINANDPRLKKVYLDKKFDRYLYRYKQSRAVPIRYFLKILNHLKIEPTDKGLEGIRVISKNEKRKYAAHINFSPTSSFLKVIGFIVAEGNITEKAITISNKDQEVLKVLKNSLKELNIPFHYGNQGIMIASCLWLEIIKALKGEGGSAQERTPSLIFGLKKEAVAQYLSAYCEADGGVEKNGVTIRAKSKRLISEIAYLLYYFGIIARIKETKEKPAHYHWKRKKTYWVLRVSGQAHLKKFAEHINFISKRKRKQLAEIIKKEGNTNVDIVPGLEKIPEKKLAQMKILADSDLFWDPIVEIKKVKNSKDKYVYDLTVENEVFLAGHGGMFVHNSYAVKLEILRSLMLGVDVLVVDPEHEYKALADAVNGSFFEMSLGSPHHINPFELPIPREDEKPENVLRSNITNLTGLLRIMLGGLSPEEVGIVDRALKETYAARDITPESDFSEVTPPLLSDFETTLRSMEGAESLVRRLQKYTSGTYANFFNQRSNISMENGLVIFGTRDMEAELRPMAMYVIIGYIWTKIRSQLKKRILIIDEAWWMMKTNEGGAFLSELAKRGRKYWLGVTTITQDVSDFIKSPFGEPIITNSSLQLLMKQSTVGADLVQETFDLTEEEKRRLIQAGIGEGLFFAGQRHIAIRVVASYTEDQIITTAPEEIVKIKAAKEKMRRAGIAKAPPAPTTIVTPPTKEEEKPKEGQKEAGLEEKVAEERRLLEEEQRREREEKLMKEKEQERRKQKMEAELKEIEGQLPELTEKIDLLEKTKSQLAEEKEKLEQSIKETLQEEEEAKKELEALWKKEETIRKRKEKREVEKKRQTKEKKRRAIELKRWDQQKRLQELEEKLKEASIQYDKTLNKSLTLKYRAKTLQDNIRAMEVER